MLNIIYEGNNNSIDLINTPNLVIAGYEGLNQPTSEIISLQNANLKGSRYHKSSISDRQISFTFYVYDVERTRYKLMNIFKAGEKGTLTLKNEYREGQIECYFEEMIFDRFQMLNTCQIFLRCPYPYFKGLEEIAIELDNIISLFELEAYIPEEGIELGQITDEYLLTINNESDTETGFELTVITESKTQDVKIYNETTNKFMVINYPLTKGEKLIISTYFGNKKVEVEKNGVITNIINKLKRDSTFFMLARGNNTIRCEGEDLTVYIRYNNEYEAI